MAAAMRQRGRPVQTSHPTDDASEDELQDIDADKLPSPNSAAENLVPVARKPGRPKKASADAVNSKTAAVKGTHPSPSALGAKKMAIGRKAAQQRTVLTDISNTRNILSDTEEVDDDFDLPQKDAKRLGALPTPMMTTKTRGRKAKPVKAKKESVNSTDRRGRTAAAAAHLVGIPETQEDTQDVQEPAPKKATAVKRVNDVIPDTQPEPMVLETSEDHPMEDLLPDVTIPRAVFERSRSVSKGRQPPVARTRGVSASAERRGTDAIIRRQLDDMTSRFETLEIKYKGLKDIAGREAEVNFEKLKRLADEKTKAANELIVSLRSDIRAQDSIVTEITSTRKELIAANQLNERLTVEKKQAHGLLHDAQNEIKALQAKLAATRASSSAIQSTEVLPKVPGSAVKPSHASTRTLLVGSAEAAKDAQKRILKEELYGDLTGLIVRDVKRKEAEGEDVYDCIQTGRNGTLHFHLTVANPTTASTAKTPSGTGTASSNPYDDTEFQYTPLLDSARDKDLIEILPDYLTEEICFPRSNAAKFYARVVDCMTKRLEVIENSDEGDVADE